MGAFTQLCPKISQGYISVYAGRMFFKLYSMIGQINKIKNREILNFPQKSWFGLNRQF